MHMAGEGQTGNETYVLNLASALRGIAGPEDRFVLAATHPEAVRRAVAGDSRFAIGAVSSWSVRRLAVDLPRWCLNGGVQVAHFTYFPSPRVRCPVVVTVHDVAFLSHPEWFSPRDRLVLRAGAWLTRRRAARLLTLSEFSREEIVRRLGVSSVRVTAIPLAAGDAFTPAGDPAASAEALARLGIRKPYILAVGNLQPRKNLSRLIDAFAEAKRSGGLPHTLVLAGRAQWKSHRIFRSARDAGLLDAVLFTGYVAECDLPHLYREAELFAYPSLYEGFGLPVLEAMACGTPVVASNAASIPEVAGGAAILVDPLDTAALARALLEAAGSPERRRDMRERGLARARQFSWGRAAADTYRVYREVAGEPAA